MSLGRDEEQANLEAGVVEWLGHLYDDVEGGQLTLVSLDPTKGRAPYIDWADVDDYDALAAHVLRRAPHCEVWWGVATRRARLLRGRGEAPDCAHVPALWLDVDIAGPGHKGTKDLPPDVDAARELIARYPHAPTAVVHSGGGLQAWWLLAEPATGGEVAPLLARWGHTWAGYADEAGWHLDNVFDLARVMRMPGTWNRKLDGRPRPVQIIESDWALRYGLDDLDQHLSEPPPAAPKPARAPWDGPQRPGDAFNSRHSVSEVLQAAGWHHSRTDRDGRQQWTRPGKDSRKGTSATVYADEDGHLTVWSDAIPELEVKRPYDAFGLYAALQHGGDHRAASDALEARGYGTKRRRRDDLSWVPQVVERESTDEAPEPPGEPVPPGAWLPEEFWSRRPVLTHIRQAAHNRRKCADAVLHLVLARVAAISPHTLRLPGLTGTEVTLSYYAAITGASGDGKSSSDGVALDLVPERDGLIDHIPLGSGEGLAELFFEHVKEEGPDDKTVVVKRQVHHNAYIWVDEGETLTEIGGRRGATIMQALRTAWVGGVLGQANATKETHRVVPRLSYVVGMGMAIPSSRAGALFDDAAGGTPQRFAWAESGDPSIPDEKPPWPGELDWQPPPRISTGETVQLASEVEAEVDERILARARRELIPGPLDGHRDLIRLKIAALLAILDGRKDLSCDDWDLAGTVVETSIQVRDGVLGIVAAEGARREAAARDRHAERETEADVAKERRSVVDCARKIAEKVAARPDGVTWSQVHRSLTKRLREAAEAGLDHAKAEGWVSEEEASGQGTQKRVLRPGKGSE